MSSRYVRREPRSTIYVAFCLQNGPCDHTRHTEPEQALECAGLLTASTGHWHAVKEASSISGNVFDSRPMHPARTADKADGKIGRHPLTPGVPCR